jgi:proteasome lid subunit RPN8/RPN11
MPSIPRALVDEMIAHAREDLPNEACGMVHALDGAPATVHRVTNVAASPYRYEMAPLEMLRLDQRRGRKRQRVPRGQPGAGRFTGGVVEETLFAIYHSHVASQAWPSPTDVRQAFWPPGETAGTAMYPETYYIVVSLVEDPPPVRAFLIRPSDSIEDCVEPAPLEVV